MKKIVAILLIGISLIGLNACKSEEVKIKSSNDLKDKVIAVQKGSVGHERAEEVVGGAQNDKQILAFDKYADMANALKQKKADAIIMDIEPAKVIIEKNSELIILDEEFGEKEEFAFAVKKDNIELLEEINAVFTELKTNGELEKIKEKYLAEGKEDVDPEAIDFNSGAENGKIIMGTEAGFPPFEMRSGDTYFGIDVEIAAEIAKKLNKELIIEDMNFDALIAALKAEKVDFVAAGMTINEERKNNVDFSEVYAESAQVVIIRKESLATK